MDPDVRWRDRGRYTLLHGGCYRLHDQHADWGGVHLQPTWGYSGCHGSWRGRLQSLQQHDGDAGLCARLQQRGYGCASPDCRNAAQLQPEAGPVHDWFLYEGLPWPILHSGHSARGCRIYVYIFWTTADAYLAAGYGRAARARVRQAQAPPPVWGAATEHTGDQLRHQYRPAA